ncbi:MAG: GDYXXLXY domain-containing protein [Dethiobacter sp.]|jgi:uncharacterized membrane-anchored protein|nr:GDYXXLXY domain-containing protein [Dethiobacter sp.]
MKRRYWFTLAVALQIAVLFVMMGAKGYTLAYGTKIYLKTLPVDPWDLFRGDYVILRYEISELDLKTVTSGSDIYNRNDKVYVTLEEQGKYWVARSVSKRRPDDGSLAISGTVRYYNEYSNTLHVIYGIESYFVPQHQGRSIEDSRATLDAEVSVDRWGNSGLSRLFINGEEVRFQ